MQASLHKPPQKVKNILIRSSNKEKQYRSVQHPEISYILKYSPKYYRSLTIEITPYSPLLSKIKKVKKLKKLRGLTEESFKDSLFQKLRLNLLSNNRKEMEEAPELLSNQASIEFDKPFWKEFNMQKMKFFPNVTRILLSKWRISLRGKNPDPFLTMKKGFIRYIGNLRKLKSLEIIVKDDNYKEVDWVIRKLDTMSILLERLGTFIIKIKTQHTDAQSLFDNKNIFSHLTGLDLPMSFNPIFAQTPQICKKLNSLSLGFKSKVAGQPEFLDLLDSMQQLDQLKRLAFAWPGSAKNFWSHFKPHSNLRQLVLIFNVSNLISEGLFGTNMEPKDAVRHWEDIQEVDILTFNVSCEKVEEMIFAKQFITMILKKVRKVRVLKYYLMSPWVNDNPFFVEEVSHLYEGLERFEWLISDWYQGDPSKVDLKILEPFRNLKELKLEGGSVVYENVEEVVDGISALEVKIRHMANEDWLGETLKKIEESRREDKDLRVLFDLTFKTDNFVGLLERLCQDLHAVKNTRGLVISLTLYNDDDASPLPVEKLKEVLRKYAEVRNWKVSLWNELTSMEYINVDGERAQFYVH